MQFIRPRRRKAPELGALELNVLKVLWAAAPDCVDARGVHDALAARRISLSTVQATLERLHRKNLLARSKVGRAYHYSPTVTREHLIGSLIHEVAERIAEGDLAPVISGFVEWVNDTDSELAEELAASVAKRRTEPTK